MQAALQPRPRFSGDADFLNELKRRVQGHFARNQTSTHADGRMIAKTVVLLAWFGLSYGLLVFGATHLWQGIVLSCSLALSIAGIGFGIQHDANHGAYSRNAAVNRILGLTLDLVGGSSYVWRWKHNVFHHTYTNLSDADADIDLRPFGRLAPGQPRRRFYRFQQFYLWALYGFLGPKWHFVDDFKNVAQARIGGHRFPRPRGWALVEFLAAKAAFFAWTLVVPLLFHGFALTALFYALTWFVVGVVLSVVFQLAHCVEEAEFPQPETSGSDRIACGWAEHQVRTTVDFAPRGQLLTWYLGGLNYQIEHHLLPRICHVHYPAISPIVRQTCADFGVRYVAQERFLGALRSHFCWLRRMGRVNQTDFSSMDEASSFHAMSIRSLSTAQRPIAESLSS